MVDSKIKFVCNITLSILLVELLQKSIGLKLLNENCKPSLQLLTNLKKPVLAWTITALFPLLIQTTAPSSMARQ